MLYGVDIHAQYQAGISLPALKSQGYSFVVTKASEGLGIPSNATLSAAQFKARYLAWIRECRQIGLIPGLYHWIRAGNGAAQARFFHSLVVEAGGPRGLTIALDCEDDASYADVVAWRDEWRRLSGGHPFLLYTGGWWWRPRGWDGAAITPYLWDSHYLTADADTIQDDPATFAARVPADWWSPGYGGWGGATILQFTSRGDAGSLGNNVDLNATRLTREQLLALTGDDDMPLTDEEHIWVRRLHQRTYALNQLLPSIDLHGGEGVEQQPLPQAVKDIQAGLAALRAEEAAREAREVARDAGQTELIRGLADLAGVSLTDEQLDQLAARTSTAIGQAVTGVRDDVLAELRRQEDEREAAMRAALDAETAG